jgi:predicted CXXCH cytochrome family protein
MNTRKPPGWPFGTGPTEAILCTTCHSVHGARRGSPLLRKTQSPDFCEECHEEESLEYHHPLTSGRCGENLPPPAYGGAAGKMYCSICHRAHNAGLGESDESLFVPLLRQRTDAGDYCSTCHPSDNPTCGVNPDYRASHFLGDPSLPETYNDSTPPLRKDAWEGTGLFSTYGGPDGLTITCLSCHSFKEGAILSGEAGNTVHLVARSGNNVEWEEGEEGTYLCTGCHSANPSTEGSGTSHPLMNADASALAAPPEPPMTVTPGGHLNCDSCHRSHEAVTSAGTYILEVITGDNTDPTKIHPKIDFTSLCRKCHGASGY